MAEKTYKIIRRTEYENRGSAPVYVDTSEILRDAAEKKTVMQLKLYNNCAKTVRSAYFNVGCFDESLNLCMQLKNVPYVNVDAKPNTVFGNSQVVEVPDITRSVFVETAKVLFEDGTSWANPNQVLAEDIVSEEALGEEWLRLRLTKEIKDKNSKSSAPPKRKSLMSANKKIAVWISVIAAVVVLALCGMGMQRHFSARQLAYKTAMNLYVNRDFEAAAPALDALSSDYKYYGDDRREINYSAAISYMNTEDYQNALVNFLKCGDYKSSVSNMRTILNMFGRLISTGYNHSAAVQKDGTVIAVGNNSYGQCDTQEWSGIIGVAAGGNHTIGMTYDGMLFGCGNNDYGQCDVSGWTDIVAVDTGEGHTVAIKSNGRVIARGNNEYGQCDVQEWADVVQIAVSANHTIGLKSDGTVLAAGWNEYGQCDVSGESNVLFVATGEKNTVLVKYDGSVKVLGDNSFNQCDLSDIENIVSASVGPKYIVYTDVNGKTKSKGDNSQNQGSVSLWNNVIAVSCGSQHTLGLSVNGGIYSVGDETDGKLKLSKIGNIGAENIPIME